MNSPQKAEVALIINQQVRTVLREVTAHITDDPQEQMELASAVVALLLRDLYVEFGHTWLERVVQIVLQPPPRVAPPS